MYRALICLLISIIALSSCIKKTEEQVQAEREAANPGYLKREKQTENLKNLSGFREFKLGADISKYPDLVRVPSEDISLLDNILTAVCYEKVSEDLKFSDLTARAIRYYFYKNKLTIIVITIYKPENFEFEKTLNKLYNTSYEPDILKADYNDSLTTKFENDKLDLFIKDGSVSDFIYYKSKPISEQIEKDIADYKTKVVNERENKF